MTEPSEQDIMAALEGRPSMAEREQQGVLVRTLEGRRGPDEEYHHRRIAEALGCAARPRTVTEGELPIRTREFEATRRYVAQGAIDEALEKLIAHISAQRDSDREPGAVADEIREAAYAQMARVSSYESERLEGVAAALEKAISMDPRQAIREVAADMKASTEATDHEILAALKGRS